MDGKREVDAKWLAPGHMWIQSKAGVPGEGSAFQVCVWPHLHTHLCRRHVHQVFSVTRFPRTDLKKWKSSFNFLSNLRCKLPAVWHAVHLGRLLGPFTAALLTAPHGELQSHQELPTTVEPQRQSGPQNTLIWEVKTLQVNCGKLLLF